MIVELTTGLPASGKSTYAKLRVQESGNRMRRVNLDSLRGMCDNGTYSQELERSILTTQTQIVVQHVREGYDVIVDNTHLEKRGPEMLRSALAPFREVEWKVADFRDVPMGECIRRDAARAAKGESAVGPEVIRRMAMRTRRWALTEDWLNAYPKPRHYQRPSVQPRAVIYDIDGTLALHGDRSPYDTGRCLEDRPNPMVVEHLKLMHGEGYKIILASGRDGSFRALTAEWLQACAIPYDLLLMRAHGDTRKDDIIKSELFDLHIRHQFGVELVVDDRDRVVSMWRSMGLPTWQVAEGNF